MPEPYPPAGFHFRVEFQDVPGLVDGDFHFQSVAGLSSSFETEKVKEGGENRFTHALPVRTEYPDLVLKRGVVKDSGLIRWCRAALEGFSFRPSTVVVTLLNEEHEPLVSWNVVHAWPTKWSTADLDAEKSAVLIETLELSYNYFTVDHSAPSGEGAG